MSILGFLRELLDPRATQVHLDPTDGPRLVFDLSGELPLAHPAIPVADASLERIQQFARVAAPGTVFEIYGLHLLPQRPDDVARAISRIARRHGGLQIHLDVSTASTRWRRRFAGNLYRFGCIERTQAISHLH